MDCPEYQLDQFMRRWGPSDPVLLPMLEMRWKTVAVVGDIEKGRCAHGSSSLSF